VSLLANVVHGSLWKKNYVILIVLSFKHNSVILAPNLGNCHFIMKYVLIETKY